jgi:hypothetical protein
VADWKQWFRNSRPLLEREGAELYGEVKEALRRQQIDGAGADAFDKRARAASDLLRALENTPNALIRLGDVVIAKATVNGQSRLLIETLSPQLAREMEKNSLVRSDPVAFFAFIDKEVSRDRLP